MKLSPLLWQIFLLIIIDLTLAELRNKRSIKALTGLFTPKTPSPLSNYPIWKVHKYTGIDLRPVRPEEHHPHDLEFDHEPRETLGQPPSFVEVPDFGDQVEDHEGEILAGHEIEDTKETLDIGPVASWLTGHPGSTSALLGYLGLDRSDQQAEERLLKPSPLIVKKKIISLAALAALLKKAAIAKVPIKTAAVGIKKVVGGVVHKVITPPISYPIRSAIYREIPIKYPKGPSLLSKLPIIGSHFAPSGTPIKLVEPFLPKIPALKLVPEAPKLPHLYLPGPYKVPYSTGSYVSIRVPTPPQLQNIELPSHGPPATSYGVPDQEYGPPTKESQPAEEYGAPEYQLPQPFTSASSEYQLPLQYSSSAGQYQQFPPSAAPIYQAAQLYNAPVSQTAQQYSAPEYQLTQQYSAPATDYQPAQQYSAPVSQPAQQYSVPAPEYQPAQQYNAPVQQYSSTPEQSNDASQYNSYPPAQKKLFEENESSSSAQLNEKIESTLVKSENNQIKSE